VAKRSYRRDALASEYFQSPRAALLVQGGNEFDLGDFKISSDSVIHDRNRRGVDVFGTRRPWVYMQSRTGRFLHLGKMRKSITNALRPD